MKYSYIFLLLLVIFCNTEDDYTPINTSPIDFSISVENITTNSVEVNWTSARGENSSAVLYAIYLNNHLIVSELDQESYHLQELNDDQLYSVKIIATNESGSSEASQEFTTLENVALFLNRYELIDGETLLEYNANQNIQKLRYTHSTEYYYNKTTSYIYDTENRILTETGSMPMWDFKEATYTYESNINTNILLRDGLADARAEHEIDFIDELSYVRTEYYIDMYRNYIATHNVSLFKDSNGNVTKIISFNVDDNIESTYIFEYDNNNLTKIIDPQNNVFEMVYDNYSNFHTYPSGFSNGWVGVNDCASLLFLDAALTKKLRLLPSVFNHVNTNNPIEYKINGATYRSFEYEYNMYNYPTKLTTDGLDINLFYD